MRWEGPVEAVGPASRPAPPAHEWPLGCTVLSVAACNKAASTAKAITRRSLGGLNGDVKGFFEVPG